MISIPLLDARVTDIAAHMTAARHDDWLIALARAKTTPCGVSGCTGEFHDSPDAAEWCHRVRQIRHSDLEVDLWDEDGRTVASVVLLVESELLGPSGLRAIVRQLTKHGAVLSSLAAELER